MLIQDILEPRYTLVLPAKRSSASFNKFHVLLNRNLRLLPLPKQMFCNSSTHT